MRTHIVTLSCLETVCKVIDAIAVLCREGDVRRIQHLHATPRSVGVRELASIQAETGSSILCEVISPCTWTFPLLMLQIYNGSQNTITGFHNLVQLFQLACRIAILVHAAEVMPDVAFLHTRCQGLPNMLDGFFF